MRHWIRLYFPWSTKHRSILAPSPSGVLAGRGDNTVNILWVHVTCKIYQGVPLYTPEKTPPIGIYRSLYFPKLKLYCTDPSLLNSCSWHQWWLRRRLKPLFQSSQKLVRRSLRVLASNLEELMLDFSNCIFLHYSSSLMVSRSDLCIWVNCCSIIRHVIIYIPESAETIDFDLKSCIVLLNASSRSA